MNQAECIKAFLMDDIADLASHPEEIAKNPDTDFSRNRSVSAEDTISFQIFMESDTLDKEWLNFLGHSTDAPTTSAWYQQRRKLLPDTFRKLLEKFNGHFQDSLYNDKYVLTAVDGSGFNLFYNPNDPDTYIEPNSASQKGHNEIHVVAAYRLLDRTFSDAVIQPSPKKNEYSAICEIVDRDEPSGGVPLYLADRGFPSLNFYAHCNENGAFFLARAKDLTVERLLGGDRPDGAEEYDVTIDRIIIRSRKKKNLSKPCSPEIYRYVDKNTKFDFIEPGAPGEYPLHLRVVRVWIKDGVYENLVTNLPKEEFDIQALSFLYYLRWGIETAFREFKLVIGAADFHSKSLEYITHELWARFTLHNFCSHITKNVVVEKQTEKYQYQVNFTMAIKNCHDYLRQKVGEEPFDILGLIGRFIRPIRPDRNFARQQHFRSPLKFTYRH